MLHTPNPDSSVDVSGSLSKPVEGALLLSVRAENGLGQHYLDPGHPVVRACVELANKVAAKDVLDLACGRGLTSLALAQETAVQSIVATDINQPGLDELALRVKAENAPIEVQNFDAAGPAVPSAWNGRFDLVVAKDLFPFLDPAGVSSFLKNSATALEDKGWLIFSAPSADSRLYRESTPTPAPFYVQLSDSGMAFVQTTLTHFSFATPEYMRELLDAHGFELRSIEPFGREGGWMTVTAQKA
jgi:predicted TPR repeat methyltransferase